MFFFSAWYPGGYHDRLSPSLGLGRCRETLWRMAMGHRGTADGPSSEDRVKGGVLRKSRVFWLGEKHFEKWVEIQKLSPRWWSFYVIFPRWWLMIVISSPIFFAMCDNNQEKWREMAQVEVRWCRAWWVWTTSQIFNEFVALRLDYGLTGGSGMDGLPASL